MFFTQELLSRRDSGFGLLWLAATLGPRSNLKKLARRDVMNADISELCDLIIEPAEPLALRLSSNLLVGVARVYKVKHENFVSDITAFSTTLKKAIQDLASGALDLHMGQSTVRPDTVTMAVDPVLGIGMNFDDFLESYESAMEDGSDDEYGKRRKRKGKQPAVPIEQRRADAHTLDEDIEHLLSGSQLLSASFDQSFVQGSSSQQDGGPGFDVFQDHEQLDLGMIGDEIAAELGDDWRADPAPKQDQPMDMDDPFAVPGMDAEGGDFMFANFGQSDDATTVARGAGSVATSTRKRGFEELELPEQDVGGPAEPQALTPLGASPAPASLVDQPAQEADPETDAHARHDRKAKRVRLQLDARTELTDEEMKNARAAYLEHQNRVRRELEVKRLEKETGKVMDFFWNAPPEFQAPALANIWKQRVKVHIEARTGAMRVEMSNSPPQRSRDGSARPAGGEAGVPGWDAPAEADLGFAGDFGGDFPADEPVVPYQDDYQQSRRSSEEPGQARRGSAPMSPLGGQFDFSLGRNVMDPASATSASQRSAVFPWDHAGLSSSSAAGGHFDPARDRISVGHREVRMRSSPASGPRSRRESSIHSSQPGGRGFSPGAFGRLGSHAPGEDFEFDIPEEGVAPEDQEEDTQGDGNTITLERNSYNFLEYARMQAQTASGPDGLSFDTIVPKATSTPHVAAAAFYHCLMLATKDLIRVNQSEPYEPLTIQIKG